MLPEVKQRIENEIGEQSFFKDLKADLYNFNLKKDFIEDESKYPIFNYVNEVTHRGLKAYWHDETNEYKVMINFGLNAFCLTEFFTEKAAVFVERLQPELENILKSIDEFNGAQNVFVEQKKIPTWTYAQKIQTKLECFELFLIPSKYLEVTNGSFVIINYCDFAINSDLAIFYNIFSDNFGSEARINGAPTVIYDFDADTLKELEERLNLNLSDQLKKIREEAKELEGKK